MTEEKETPRRITHLKVNIIKDRTSKVLKRMTDIDPRKDVTRKVIGIIQNMKDRRPLKIVTEGRMKDTRLTMLGKYQINSDICR